MASKKLTREAAMRLAFKKWGKQGSIEDRGLKWASTPVRRNEAQANLAYHRTRKPAAFALETLPPSMTVAEALVERAKQRATYRAWYEAEAILIGACGAHRYSVGYAGKMFFTVCGSGDSWEEALRAAGAL